MNEYKVVNAQIQVERRKLTGGLLDSFTITALVIACGVVFFGGFVKGAVGFGLPMIVIAGVGSFLPAETAVAALLLPTLVTNLYQALGRGSILALDTLKKYWRFNSIFAVTIILAAQLIIIVPERGLFIFLGTVISGFALLQIVGVQFKFEPANQNKIEFTCGIASGVTGGLSGVWGPPLIIYLLARNTPKAEQVQALGITFLLGSLILVSAHIKSGLLNATTIPFSGVLILPGIIGMVLGFRLQNRLDQAVFRRLTLIVLVVAGLNLLRRGIFI